MTREFAVRSSRRGRTVVHNYRFGRQGFA